MRMRAAVPAQRFVAVGMDRAQRRSRGPRGDPRGRRRPPPAEQPRRVDRRRPRGPRRAGRPARDTGPGRRRLAAHLRTPGPRPRRRLPGRHRRRRRRARPSPGLYEDFLDGWLVDPADAEVALPRARVAVHPRDLLMTDVERGRRASPPPRSTSPSSCAADRAGARSRSASSPSPACPRSAAETTSRPSSSRPWGPSGDRLRPGDAVAVSSKVVSKALGLVVAPAAGARRPGQRWSRARPGGSSPSGCTGGAVTRVVESLAGPVMAAAGVDASNTGPDGGLPPPAEPDADAVAAGLRATCCGMPPCRPTPPSVSSSRTRPGRPWRDGQVDFALGSAGLVPARGPARRPRRRRPSARGDDPGRRRRGRRRRRPRQGQGDAVPAALVRGLPVTWLAGGAPGAGSLVRTGPGDWFALGQVEAVRAALGAPPGSPESDPVGLRVDRAGAPRRPGRSGRRPRAARCARRGRRRRSREGARPGVHVDLSAADAVDPRPRRRPARDRRGGRVPPSQVLGRDGPTGWRIVLEDA